MIFVGIDPGQSGCIAVQGAKFGKTDTAFDLMKLDGTEADIAAFLSAISGYNPAFIGCYIERVHSMPKQGVASSFKFGKNYGFLRGCLISHRIPFEEVTPQKWQKLMGCMSKGDKNVTKARAQQLFPREKITHANADAILISEYAKRVIRTRQREELDRARTEHDEALDEPFCQTRGGELKPEGGGE